MILYETSSHYYLVGYDSEETSFRVLKIDRRIVRPKTLNEILLEDPCVYSKEDLAEMLEMVNEGINYRKELPSTSLTMSEEVSSSTAQSNFTYISFMSPSTSSAVGD